MDCTEIKVPLHWGHLNAQIFGVISPNKHPIIAVHGFLDNSNSFKPVAPYLVNTGKYYLISIDLPGHGFSSHIPTGVYSSKVMLICIRRLVKYLKLKNIIFMSHSYGCNLNLLYTACYPNEVAAVILIDYSFQFVKFDAEFLMDTWNQGIDFLIDNQYDQNKDDENSDKVLTEETALEILLKANRTIDENAAKLLLERALTVQNGKLNFSRDKFFRDQVRWRPKNLFMNDHYAEFCGMVEALKNCSTNPTLLIFSFPSFFGENFERKTINTLKTTKNKIAIEYMPGTHHFHMLKPEETSKLILNFLDEHLNENWFETKSKL